MTLVREAETGGVECIPPHGTVSRAAEIMTRTGVGALPICDVHGQLLGELLTGHAVSIDADEQPLGTAVARQDRADHPPTTA